MAKYRTKIILTGILILAVGILSWRLWAGCSSESCSTQKPNISPTNVKWQDGQVVKLQIGDQTILAEIAQSPETKARGLSGQKEIKPENGLLFIFNQPNYYPFWMKEMNFPIDIVWLDKNWQVVDLTEDFSPTSYPQTVTPSKPAQYVLELQVNQSKNLGLKIGEMITIAN